MFFDLLHLGDGKQALNYFVLCFFAILGALQLVAAKYHRRDLLWTNSAIGRIPNRRKFHVVLCNRPGNFYSGACRR